MAPGAGRAVSSRSAIHPRAAGAFRLSDTRTAKFSIGQIVRHLFYPFRGVIYDVDPVFANTEQWWQSIPAELRPAKDQPYYHLLAENQQTTYEAYVSEQNLLPDESGGPCRHPLLEEWFEGPSDGRYALRARSTN